MIGRWRGLFQDDEALLSRKVDDCEAKLDMIARRIDQDKRELESMRKYLNWIRKHIEKNRTRNSTNANKAKDDQ